MADISSLYTPQAGTPKTTSGPATENAALASGQLLGGTGSFLDLILSLFPTSKTDLNDNGTKAQASLKAENTTLADLTVSETPSETQDPDFIAFIQASLNAVSDPHMPQGEPQLETSGVLTQPLATAPVALETNPVNTDTVTAPSGNVTNDLPAPTHLLQDSAPEQIDSLAIALNNIVVGGTQGSETHGMNTPLSGDTPDLLLGPTLMPNMADEPDMEAIALRLNALVVGGSKEQKRNSETQPLPAPVTPDGSLLPQKGIVGTSTLIDTQVRAQMASETPASTAEVKVSLPPTPQVAVPATKPTTETSSAPTHEKAITTRAPSTSLGDSYTPTQAGPDSSTTGLASQAVPAAKMIPVSSTSPLSGDAVLEFDLSFLDPTRTNTFLSANTITTPGAKAAMSPAGSSMGASPQTAVQHVALHLQQMAGTRDTRSLTLELNPPELGRMQIKMSYGRDKTVKADLLIEKPDTLALMKNDSNALKNALEQAGLTADSGSLNFSLADQGTFARHDDAGNARPSGTQATEDNQDIIGSLEVKASEEWSVDPRTGIVRYNIIV